MARLLGFSKTKAEGAASSDQMIRILEKTYLARTATGQYQTTQDVEGLIGTLKGMAQTPDVMEKIADLEDKKLQIQTKLGDILASKNVFDTDLQAGLDGAAKANFKNMKSLIGSYAAIYGDAADRYDSEVMGQVAQRYGTTDSIPQENLDYRKTLAEKAKFYAQLFNSYNVRDEKTGEIGLLDPSGIAVKVDTNPVNGSVQHIEIIPSGQVDGKNYMRTEVGVNVVDGLPNKKLPIYLRVNDVGTTADGKTIRGSTLGNIQYQEKINDKASGATGSAGVLVPHQEHVGFFSKLNFFSDTPAEKLNKSIDSVTKNGVSFSNDSYKYDSNDIPNETVLKMGTRVFYSTGKDGQILEITGKDGAEKQDNLNKYLTGIGKDPNKILPYFITKDYLTAPDGNSRVQGKVDANYFNAPTIPGAPTSFNAPKPSPLGFGGSLQPAALTDSFFSKPGMGTQTTTPSIAVNRPNKPDAAPVGSEKKISIGDLVEKGKSFFRNRIA